MPAVSVLQLLTRDIHT
jgi:hypothetical protein